MKNKALIFTITILTTVFLFNSCGSYPSQLNFAAIKQECQDNDISLFNDNPYIVLMPEKNGEHNKFSESPKAGIIFYPGALVSYEAYLPLFVECAKANIACFIIQVPSDFAIMDTNAAFRVQCRYLDISDWYIAGHSLGGAMAADYVASHKSDFTGLILLAAYSTKNLRGTGLKVLSIFGKNDGVLKQASYTKYKENLPSDNEHFKEVIIEGGNHAGFASYGPQKGDKPFGTGDDTLPMTAEKQQQITANEIITMINM